MPHFILASDGEDQSAPPLPALDIETATPDELRARIHDCGIVGLGGAGFPTARKLGHPANTLVINAAECEPYITCDDLQIRENAAAIIRGAQITARILGADNIHFGIEDDKPEAIAALRTALDAAADPRIRISSVPVRYPSGNARQLFELLLGIRVPADAHASDYGLICHNSGTMKAAYRTLHHHQRRRHMRTTSPAHPHRHRRTRTDPAERWRAARTQRGKSLHHRRPDDGLRNRLP